MNVRILNKNAIRESINKHSNKLFEHAKKEVILSAKNSKILSTKNGIQTAMYVKTGNSLFDKVIKPAIILDCIDSEIMAPGSGDISLNITSMLLERLYGKVGSSFTISQYMDSSSELLEYLSENTKRVGNIPTKKDFNKFLNQEILDPKLRILLKSAIELSASRREIICKVSNSYESSIEVEEGFKFKTKPNQDFVKEKWKRKNAIILTIDGAIIEVSEIHHLLELCSEKNVPAVIFCRNFSPDVLNTLYVNKKRGTLDIVPVEIGIENETLNMLKDIAIVSGSRFISADMGDLISTSVRKGIKRVDLVEVTRDYVKIFNSNTKNEVDNHLDFLKNKRKNIEAEALPFIDNRIRSMTSGAVIVNIGQEMLGRDKISIEKIDTFLRSLSMFFGSGCVRSNQLERILINYKKNANSIQKIQIECIIESLGKQDKKIFAAGSFLKALKTSLSTSSSMFSTSIVIAEDR
jgi:hypothetical protein